MHGTVLACQQLVQAGASVHVTDTEVQLAKDQRDVTHWVWYRVEHLSI
jgi:hypothetical protein